MLVCVCVCVCVCVGAANSADFLSGCQHFICMQARVNVNYEHQTRLPSPKSSPLPPQGPPIPSHVPSVVTEALPVTFLATSRSQQRLLRV